MTKRPVVFIDRVDPVIEDGGQAKWAEINDGGDDGLFVRIHSWSVQCQHPEFDALVGQKVRVTIEVVDDG